MKINGLHHVAYAIQDIAKVRTFWQKLGFTLLNDQKKTPEGTESILWIGQVQIQLHPTSAVPMAAVWRENKVRDDLYQICLEVDDLQDAITTLHKAGIEATTEPEDTVQGRQFYIDPKYTGIYHLGFIELNDSLKHKDTANKQENIAKLLGYKNLDAKKLSSNNLGMTNIHHIGISVADYERARHLWQDILGFDAIYQHFKERNFKEDAMYLGDAQIHLYRSDNPELKFYSWPRKNGDGMETLSVVVDNINKAISALRAAEMDISGLGPESMSQGMSVFIDKKYTNGNDFEIVEMHYFLRGKTIEQQKKIVYHFFGNGTVL